MLKDIATCFFKVLYPGYIPTKDELIHICKEGEFLLRKGWTVTNITNKIINFYENNKYQNYNIKSLYQVVSPRETPPLFLQGNLLKNEFYYHTRLQRLPKPTEVIITEDGDIIRKTEPFYLEMIEYFSIDDLTNYFHEKMQINDSNIYRLNRGGFNKIINNYSLDLLLFTIDVAFRDRKDKDLSLLINYSELYNYLDLGKSALNFSRNNSTNKIVPYYRAYLKMRERGEIQ